MTDKSLQWRQLLADCAGSGLGVQRWCAARNIPEHRYYYWRRKLTPVAEVLKQAVEWMALPADGSANLTVHVGGASIDVAAGFDVALLRAVVEALAAQC